MLRLNYILTILSAVIFYTATSTAVLKLHRPIKTPLENISVNDLNPRYQITIKELQTTSITPYEN